jgi:tRNA1(Val) A37 N6-methylase TrmN6
LNGPLPDTLFGGKLIIQQPLEGYRFSVDPILLAHFCRIDTTTSVLDLGTGCGIIMLLLAHRHPNLQLSGLELQEELLEHAVFNCRANNLQGRTRLIHGNLREVRTIFSPESFDHVVVNPPYQPLGSGRINPQRQIAEARHEINSCLAEVVDAAAFVLRNKGFASVVYPATRTTELLSAFTGKKIYPSRLRPVYSYPEAAHSTLVLVEAVKNGGNALELLAPLYIYSKSNGPYSQEVASYYQG